MYNSKSTNQNSKFCHVTFKAHMIGQFRSYSNSERFFWDRLLEAGARERGTNTSK